MLSVFLTYKPLQQETDAHAASLLKTDIDRLDLQLCTEIITSSNCAEYKHSRERHAAKQRKIINEMIRYVLGGEAVI